MGASRGWQQCEFGRVYKPQNVPTPRDNVASVG